MSTTKTCSKCGEEKLVDEFYKDKRRRGGLYSCCKACHLIRTKRWDVNNIEEKRKSARDWHKKNRRRATENARAWRGKNPEKVAMSTKKWREHNPEKCKQTTEKWRERNPEKYKRTHNKAVAKMESTPKGRIRKSMGASMRKALKNGKGGYSWEVLAGYTAETLKKHLEDQFTDGMSWKNYGKWHIDHIVPVSAFNFKTPDDIDFKRCWALGNLQPLWAKENIIKKDRLTKPFQPSLAFGG